MIVVYALAKFLAYGTHLPSCVFAGARPRMGNHGVRHRETRSVGIRIRRRRACSDLVPWRNAGVVCHGPAIAGRNRRQVLRRMLSLLMGDNKVAQAEFF